MHHNSVKKSGLGAPAADEIDLESNYLLSAVPMAERERLTAALKRIYVPIGSVLFEQGDSPHHIYFPTDCTVSILNELHDGSSAGIAIIGNEGAVGLEAFTGSDRMINRAVVQGAGFAYSVSAARFKQEFLRQGELYRHLLRYTQAMITQISQTVVCNAHHSVDQRLCRWLLAAQDRVSSTELAMTHDLIANFLGVRREGVTVAAKRLQRRGIINYRRGQIAVIDRHGLEQLCCECYEVVSRETKRLHPGFPLMARRLSLGDDQPMWRARLQDETSN